MLDASLSLVALSAYPNSNAAELQIPLVPCLKLSATLVPLKVIEDSPSHVG